MARLTTCAADDMPLVLRHLHSVQDYADCVRLQQVTWGESFRETVPAAVLKISQRVGGIAAGAFDASGAMLGFVFGLTGFSQGRPVHWSHMLAVHPDCRDQGVGRQLKEFQRAQLAVAGVETICWTYDPLVARNAYLNLNRLGVEVVEYIPDMYAPTGSDLHAIGTDRLVVCWQIKGSQLSAPRPGTPCRIVNEAGAMPGDLALDPCVGIEIPIDITALQEQSVDAALQWRATTRTAFRHYLAAGYRVTCLCRDDGAHPYYILCK